MEVVDEAGSTNALVAERARSGGPEGLVILAVTVDEDIAVAREFATRKKLPFILLEDHAGKVADRYDVEAMPHSVLIDANGTIVREFEGSGDGTEKKLLDAVAIALDSGAQPPHN